MEPVLLTMNSTPLLQHRGKRLHFGAAHRRQPTAVHFVPSCNLQRGNGSLGHVGGHTGVCMGYRTCTATAVSTEADACALHSRCYLVLWLESTCLHITYASLTTLYHLNMSPDPHTGLWAYCIHLLPHRVVFCLPEPQSHRVKQ